MEVFLQCWQDKKRSISETIFIKNGFFLLNIESVRDNWNFGLTHITNSVDSLNLNCFSNLALYNLLTFYLNILPDIILFRILNIKKVKMTFKQFSILRNINLQFHYWKIAKVLDVISDWLPTFCADFYNFSVSNDCSIMI